MAMLLIAAVLISGAVFQRVPEDPMDAALARWEKTMTQLETATGSIEVIGKDRALRTETKSEGTFKYAKPRRYILEVQQKDAGDSNSGKRIDYEKFFNDGKFLYICNAGRKEILQIDTSYRFNFWGGEVAIEGPVHSILLGMKAAEAKNRFQLRIPPGKERDDWYVYIEIKPRNDSDKIEFEAARLVLDKKTYLPRQFWMRAPNGYETTWNLKKIETGVKLNDDDWKPNVPDGWRLISWPHTVEK